jgi:phage portal protein BeeE
MILEQELSGIGSNPYIVFRWNKASGEVFGRGPVFNAMAAIKTTNLTVELILQNAQMNISGIYTYEDDGVINPDNINLVPGSLIPVAPNSRGLTPLAGVGRFDVAQLILGDMRQNIRKALYMETLGRPVVNNFNAILAQTFGPQILNLIVKQDEVARYMAEKLGLPEKLIRDPQEQQALVNELQNMAQQGNMPGNVMGNPTQQEQ